MSINPRRGNTPLSVVIMVIVAVIAVSVVMLSLKTTQQSKNTSSFAAEEDDSNNNFTPSITSDPRPTFVVSTHHHIALPTNTVPMSNQECQNKGGTCVWSDSDYDSSVETCENRQWTTVGLCKPENPFPIGFCCIVK